MLVGILPACLSMHHIHAYCHGGQKKVSCLLELELQIVVYCHAGAQRSGQCS